MLRRTTRTGGHVYVHLDKRRTSIHYHHDNDTLDRKTLSSVIRATQWNEDDLRRLGLL